MTAAETLRAAATRLRTQYRHQALVADWLESWAAREVTGIGPDDYQSAVRHARVVLAHRCRVHGNEAKP